MMLIVFYRPPGTFYNQRIPIFYFTTGAICAWEDLPLNVMGYCSDDADMEAVGGKVSKGFL
jgi:hypothetical protein